MLSLKIRNITIVKFFILIFLTVGFISCKNEGEEIKTDPVISTFYLIRHAEKDRTCLLYTSPSPRDRQKSRMPSSA